MLLFFIGACALFAFLGLRKTIFSKGGNNNRSGSGPGVSSGNDGSNYMPGIDDNAVSAFSSSPDPSPSYDASPSYDPSPSNDTSSSGSSSDSFSGGSSDGGGASGSW